MSEQVTFKLNGNNVTVPKGWTVMEAAKRENVRIPHFCWHPGLQIAGVCRFCMVEVVGRPKLEIACNLPVTEGLEVNTKTDVVKSAHKWGLEFHLINHPLDCPICDQAGECKLQDYYMEVGKYKSQMTRPKVLKPKALDVGSELVLDTERCILCSRCVRFEQEVTKTNALGIFSRGDRSIIGTYNEEKLTHNYQENQVDICPVGAFTSKRFRFKQRVWFLKQKESICPGCSTGCRISVHAKPQERRFFRIKPVLDKEVNGYWMCDVGRRTFEHHNGEHRFDASAAEATLQSPYSTPLSLLAGKLEVTAPSQVALLVSAQYLNEEYKAFFDFFIKDLQVTKVYQWREPTEKRDEFDSILLRGDRNANTQGLMNMFEEYGLSRPVKNEFDECVKSKCQVVIALCPELASGFPSLGSQLTQLADMPYVSLWTCLIEATELKGLGNLIPMKGFFEKKGTTLNYNKIARKLENPYPSVVFGAFDVSEAVGELKKEMRRLQGRD